jgi:D-xylonolactonase
VIVDEPNELGENPLWHPTEQRLYWTDIDGKKLLRWDPRTKKREVVLEGRTIGGFTFQANGTILLFMDKGAVSFIHGDHLHDVLKEIPEALDTRFNDVIADPAGRVFCGLLSSPERKGALYRLDRDGKITKVVDDVGTSNGMGFTRGERRMYHTDSAARKIYLYDYDRRTGAISNQRLFVDLSGGEMQPDGMTVDANDNVWSAMWDGWCVIQYSPEGKELQRIQFKARKITSVTFGGPNLATMYVTSAAKALDKAPGDEDNGPDAGKVFEVQVPGVRWKLEFLSRIGM